MYHNYREIEFSSRLDTSTDTFSNSMSCKLKVKVAWSRCGVKYYGKDNKCSGLCAYTNQTKNLCLAVVCVLMLKTIGARLL